MQKCLPGKAIFFYWLAKGESPTFESISNALPEPQHTLCVIHILARGAANVINVDIEEQLERGDSILSPISRGILSPGSTYKKPKPLEEAGVHNCMWS